MVVTAISNAYPITKGWIERMNDAGLSLLQVSVDNMEPNEVSQKSWSKIKKRLLLLKEHAIDRRDRSYRRLRLYLGYAYRHVRRGRGSFVHHKSPKTPPAGMAYCRRGR